MTRAVASLVAVMAGLTMVVLGAATGIPAAHAADSGAILTWSKANPGVAPAPRLHAAMALDPAHSATVLFGGRSGGQVLDDTWTWNGSNWTAHNPATSPPPLESASLAYDSVGKRILLFGGIGSDGNATSGTWAWDGNTWTAVTGPADPAPPARYAAAMAADSVTGTDVLFGGLSAPGSPLGDTWSWDGSRWTQNLAGLADSPPASPAGPSAPPAPSGPAPTARSGAAMTFDATRGVVLLFGGATVSGNRADTWTWDGQGWNRQAPATSPPARNDGSLAFDNATQNAVLFGGTSGNTVLGDTWMWNGATWSTTLPALSLLPLNNPPARRGASMAAGPGAQRVVLFGGQSGGTGSSLWGDTWNVVTLVTAPPATTPTTTPGSAPPTAAPAPTTTVAPTAAPTTRPSPPTTRPAPRPPLAVTARSVHPGQQVTVSGSGFAPGATVTITFHSVPVKVGTAVAGADGHFRATVSVPTDLSNGPHNIEAVGATSTGAPAVLVAQVSVLAGGSRTSWLLVAAMVALTVLLAAGAGLVLTASTRWRPFSALSRGRIAG